MVWGRRIAPPFRNWRPYPAGYIAPPQALIAKRPYPSSVQQIPPHRRYQRGRQYPQHDFREYFGDAALHPIWTFLNPVGRAARQDYLSYLHNWARAINRGQIYNQPRIANPQIWHPPLYPPPHPGRYRRFGPRYRK